MIYTPRGIIHTYQNIGTTNGRLVATFTPAGFERFFEEFGVQSQAAAGPPVNFGPDEIARLARIVEENYQTQIMEPLAGH